ncbi:putative nuclease HARBI1 [Prorops nasuta]|uniref:putative nuclease HARBI1 n=2 Tax=Prorops nasuta TaxID=863751 RepID=UPI0034CD8512
MNNSLTEFILEWMEDEEEEDEQVNLYIQAQKEETRTFRQQKNWFDILNNDDFRERFRLTKNEFIMVLRKIYGGLIYQNGTRSTNILPINQLLACLRFYATGCYMVTCADFCGFSKKSAQRIIHRVSPLIANMHSEFIKFPVNNDEILGMQQGNFQKSGFIRVIGAIDCTHVKIESYGGDDSELYRNRKSIFSINVQVIANSKLEIIDFVARWPGSAHDSTIFNHSTIKARFEAGQFGNALLLGDAGYPNLPYLMTPLQNPVTHAENLYNESQIRTRSMVERCFGTWKRSFPVLSIGTRFKTVQRTLAVIGATAVLHNILRHTLDVEDFDPNLYNAIIQEQGNEFLHNDERRYLIDHYFQNI